MEAMLISILLHRWSSFFIFSLIGQIFTSCIEQASNVCTGGCPVSMLGFWEAEKTMYHPTLDEVQQIAATLEARPVDTVQASATPGKKRPLLPLSSNLLADVETPVSAYCKAARGPYS